MMRVCHLDTCPVGIATQNPVLRRRFNGQPEFVGQLLRVHRRGGAGVAGPARVPVPRRGRRPRRAARHQGGHRPLEGRGARPHADPPRARQRLRPDAAALAPARTTASTGPSTPRSSSGAAPPLDDGLPVRLEMPIRNVNRTVGTMLGSEVTRRWGGQGLPDGTIDLSFRGSAGQSFGAFVPQGITLRLEGDANDYLAKGLSGGRVIVHPDRDAPLRRRGEHHRRQRRRPTAPPAASSTSVAWWASGSASGTPASPRSSRVWGTTAAST